MKILKQKQTLNDNNKTKQNEQQAKNDNYRTNTKRQLYKTLHNKNKT
jgi:hypothetical protein